MKCGCDSLLKAIEAYIQKADDDLLEALVAAGFADTDGTIEEISNIEEYVTQVLKEQTEYLVSSTEGAVDLESYAREVWPRVKSNDGLHEKLRLIFFEEFSSYMPELISEYMKRVDPVMTVVQITQRTRGWVQSWSAELGGIMRLNSHIEIERIISSGLQKGHGIAEFTRGILESGIRDERYKARRVAVTEVLRAHSYAQHESIIQSPAVEGHMWRHTGNYRIEPRQNHIEMDGKVVPKNKPFELLGADGVTYYPMCPRDTILPAGEAINCHCVEEPVVSEDIMGLSLEERQRLQAKAIAEDDSRWEEELNARNKARAGIK